jgi:putative cardiolipin synthase
MAPRTSRLAAPTDADTPIARAVAAPAAAHPGLTGVHPLPDGHAAFAARVLAMRAAVRSLDVQVYLWHGDTTGWCLLDEARRAAARGVRVRLLIDDNGVSGLDEALALLDAHPNLALRLFNPFPQRGALRLLGYATDFRRLNRRMHNKSFTVDGALAIVGGRNIGDAYFDAGQAESFADLDLAVIGDVVREVSASFDRYWDAPPARPAATVLHGVRPMSERAFDARVASVADTPRALEHRRAVAASSLVRDVIAGTLDWEWTRARLVADDPAKIAGPVGAPAARMLPTLIEALGAPSRTLDLVSPYFVPGAGGVSSLASLAARGVRVRVLTNSLAATDVAAVHSGYAKRRAALLRAGVALLEMRPDPGARGGARVAGRGGPMGSSSASLHAKTFALDDARIFVGSFNLDPRSADLNTEMGLVVDSPPLASRLRRALDATCPDVAWRVELDAAGRLAWRDGSAVPLRTEPGAGVLRRGLARAMAWLPIERLL